MRRHSLPPPRPALAPVEGPEVAAVLPGGRPGESRSGPWRATHHFFAQRCFPRIPLVDVPYSRQLERRLTVSEASVSLPGLGEGLSGVKVLLITDIHVGPFLKPGALENTFTKLLSLCPDLILIGGDLTTSGVNEFEPFASAFRLLEAPFGVFAVQGNHEHYTKHPEELRRAVEALGIRFLHNSSVVIERGGARLVLAGIDDLWAGHPDLDAALSGAKRVPSTEPAPVVLLSHNPDVFFEAARRGVHLVLSGHTHGGQIRIPGARPLIRQSRYGLDHGRYATDGAELVVSRGLGADGLPLRVGCPPEAVFLRLV
jgi:predicted MPP superfamily phosphohydrolase